MPKIAIVSDSHNQLDRIAHKIPACDILLHCGDATMQGTVGEITKFNADMLAITQAKHRICTPGNHDWLFQRDERHARVLMTGATVLIDETVEVEGLKIHGSPWQPTFGGWAYNLDTEEELAQKWTKIPEGTDVLITHGPPHGILDLVTWNDVRWGDGHETLVLRQKRTGSRSLLDRVLKVKPRLHAFGHIHCAYGETTFEGVRFVNAAICTERYTPDNPVVVADL